MEIDSLEGMAKKLEESARYRVLRLFEAADLPLVQLSDLPDTAALGAIVDLETTGTEDSARIVELGIVRFAFDKSTAQIYGVVDSFGALEDPGIPIPAEATAVNGITDEMVAGKRIDDSEVAKLLTAAEILISHNAGFDRPKFDRRFPALGQLAWGCSLTQVDWDTQGVLGKKLEVIAVSLGFFFQAHRAYDDCMALLNVLLHEDADRRHLFAQIWEKFSEATCRVWAVRSPFETKDTLKARGYKWSDGTREGTEKAWFLEVPARNLDEELLFLKQEIYGGSSLSVPVDTVDAEIRFSSRRGKTEWMVR